MIVLFTAIIPKLTNAQSVYLQDFTFEACANLQVGDTVVLTDTRNAQTYRVRKFADNNCWMIDNMKLAGVTLTPADSDVTSDVTLPAAATSGSSNNTTIQIWDGSAKDFCSNSANFANDSTTFCGYHYNWMAATAGTGTSSMVLTDATMSVCPKGWKLPPNSGGGSVYNLAQAVGFTNDATGSSAIQNDITGFSTRLFGYYHTGWGGMDVSGLYWLRSAYNSAGNAYSLGFTASEVYPRDNDPKSAGLSVRCVFITDTDSPTVSIDITGGEILSGATYAHTPSIDTTGTDETSGLDGVKHIWLTGDGSGFTSVVGGNGMGSEEATTAENCQVALDSVEFYTENSLVIPDEGIFTLCAQSYDNASNASIIATQTFALQGQSIIYTDGFNTLHESGTPADHHTKIYIAQDGDGFTLHGTLKEDPVTAPSSIKVCLEFTGVGSEEHPICTTVTTDNSATVDYTFDIPTADLSAIPITQDVFIPATMTTTDTATNDIHIQPVYLILYIKRDTPLIVKSFRQSNHVHMRNGQLN